MSRTMTCPKTRHTLKSLVFIVGLWLTGFSLFATGPVALKNSGERVNITSGLEYLRVSDPQSSIQNVTGMPFEPFSGRGFVSGFSNDTHWLKAEVVSSDSSDYFFEWQNSLAEYIDFYVLEPDGSFRVLKGGNFVSLARRDFKTAIPTLSLSFRPGVIQTFYMRIRSQRGFYATLTACPAEGYAERVKSEGRFESFFGGMLFFKVLFVTIMALFIVRQRTFRLFAFHTFLISATVWGFSEMFGDLFTSDPKNSAIINALPYHLLPVSCILVIGSLLPIRAAFPKWVLWLMTGIAGSSVFLTGALLADYHFIWLYLIVWNLLAAEIFCIVLCIYARCRKIRFNLIYTAPFLLSFTGYILLQLRILGFADWPWINEFSLVCVVIEIFVFILFLGQVILDYEKEKMLAGRKLLTEQLQAQKLEEMSTLKSRFFANISHEFRTPLTLLLSPMDDLIDKYRGEPVLRSMKRNAGRLLSLINQLLDVSKLEAGEMKPEISYLDMAAFINTHAGAFVSLAESRGTTLEIDQDDRGRFVYTDPEKLQTILNNLLSNAFKFTNAGDRIIVGVTYSPDHRQVVIRVKDTGTGIAEEHLDKIFDRFYQADSSNQRTYEGSGIGLALVRELTGVLQGSIEVESKEDSGTTFTLNLPVDYTTWKDHLHQKASHDQPFLPPLLPQEETNTVVDPASEQPLILVIDDNPDIRSYVKTIFEADYQVMEAPDGQDGFNKALYNIPDLVICDLMMPVLDGLSFCKMLKEDDRTSHIPVIMLTARASAESKIEGLNTGADDYLTKPFSKPEIVARVANLIRQREALRLKFEMKVVDLRPTEVKLRSVDEVFIEKLKDIIENNLDDYRFDLTRLSSELSMSPVQVRRKLKAVSGLRPVEFIRKYRLQKARALLSQNAATVSEIAYLTGFESLSYFTKMFREEFGIKPSELKSDPSS